MDITIKTKKDFERHLETLKNEFGEDFEILNGVHEGQLDFSEFMDAFVDKNVADVTIDGNANASHKDICSLNAEKGKSEDKLFAFNKIFYELKKIYGLKTAKEWLRDEYSGAFYLHDAPSSSSKSYCYAYDLTRLAKEGLFFIPNYNNVGPRHLTTFLDDLIEFISFMSNRTSGACGIPNVLVWTYYFWKKDVDSGYYIKNPDYYLRQCFQKFIYRLNQPFIRVDQSAFVNMSIFDREYFMGLFGDLIYPDGTLAIDCIDGFMEHQKVFMEVVSDIRSENMFTFPVLTYSLLYQNGKFVDEDFARWCSDHNTKWNDSNFFIGADVTTLSNCPVSGDTKILYKSDRYNKMMLSPIKDLYFNYLRDGSQPIKVLSNGNLINCKINKFVDKPEYEIKLVNGASIKTTAHHLNKVFGKDYVETKDLTTDDYLPYSKHIYTASNNMSYEDGKLVGMFLGDGSYRNRTEITYSLNIDTDADDIDFIKTYCVNKFGANITENICTSSISGNAKCVNINVNSMYLRGLIEQFVCGDNAKNKHINLLALEQSVDFRQGIIDGLQTTDGSNEQSINRLYTSSIKLKDSLVALFTSMGIVTNIIEDNRDDRLSNDTIYCIRYYTPKTRSKLTGVYINDDDYLWIKIKSINKIKVNHKALSYCLEVLDNVEPVFSLGNGIVTHNCRLLSDTTKLKGFINSIGGTELRIGSVKVNTINLMRIAYESEFDKKKYLSILKKRVTLCCKVLDVVRHIIYRNISKGLLANYCDGGIDLATQYCTVGILGLYEVIEAFKLTFTDDFGNVYYTKDGIDFASEIFNVINEVKDTFTTEIKPNLLKVEVTADKYKDLTIDYSFNVESVPGERAAVILCQKDNLLYDMNDKFIYSNQWIPLSEKCTIQEKLRTSAVLDVKCSGGAISHINLEKNFPNTDTAWDMLNYIAQQGVIYFAFNTRINECENHHGFVGTDICPVCGKPVHDTYQRIVGFLEPTRAYSKDRKREYSIRRWYEYAQLKME